MKYFPKLSEQQMSEFADKFADNYDDFYNNHWSDESDYTDEFDMLLKQSPVFKKFVEAYNIYVQDFIASDREAAAFLKTCIDLGYYE